MSRASKKDGTSSTLREASRAAYMTLRRDQTVNVANLQREIRRIRVLDRRPLPDELTLTEAAWILCTHRATVKRMIDDGRLSAHSEEMDEDRWRWCIPLDEVLELGRAWLAREDVVAKVRA